MARFSAGQHAGRYTEAVINVLAEHFPDLRDDVLGRSVRTQLTRQAEAPLRSFELIVTYTREWRLRPEDLAVGPDRWRVVLDCHKNHWTDTDKRFLDSVNARLRAIELEA